MPSLLTVDGRKFSCCSVASPSSDFETLGEESEWENLGSGSDDDSLACGSCWYVDSGSSSDYSVLMLMRRPLCDSPCDGSVSFPVPVAAQSLTLPPKNIVVVSGGGPPSGPPGDEIDSYSDSSASKQPKTKKRKKHCSKKSKKHIARAKEIVDSVTKATASKCDLEPPSLDIVTDQKKAKIGAGSIEPRDGLMSKETTHFVKTATNSKSAT